MRGPDMDQELDFEDDLGSGEVGLAGLAVLALASLMLAVIGLCGCQPTGPGAGETFLNDVREFNDGVRWDRRDEVLDRLPVAMRKDYLDRQEENADDLRVDDWELDRADLDKGKGTASVRLHFQWHREHEMIVKTTYVEQRWKREHGHWVMSELATHKGEPLPTFDRAIRRKAAWGDPSEPSSAR